MSLDFSSLLPKSPLSTTTSSATKSDTAIPLDLANAAANSKESFEAHLQEQLANAKKLVAGYGLTQGVDGENPSPINPLSDLTNPPLADAMEPGQDDQIAQLMSNAGTAISQRLMAFGQEMTSMMQELMSSLQSGDIQKWSNDKVQETVRRLRNSDKHLGKCLQGMEGQKDIPNSSEFHEGLAGDSAQATQYMSISISALTQFSLKGNLSAAEGLKEAYDSAGEKVLENNKELNVQFQFSFSMIFSVYVSQEDASVDPLKEKVAKIQNDLLDFLKSKDTETSNAFLDRIYAMMKSSETDPESDGISDVEAEGEEEAVTAV